MGQRRGTGYPSLTVAGAVPRIRDQTRPPGTQLREPMERQVFGQGRGVALAHCRTHVLLDGGLGPLWGWRPCGSDQVPAGLQT